MPTFESYQNQLIYTFRSNRNPENITQMEDYMRNHFPFLGIKTPERKALFRDFLQQHGKPPIEWLEDLAGYLYEQPEREFHYTALALIELHIKKLDSRFLPFLERLILTNSWWDSVDVIAPRLVGHILAIEKKAIRNFPDKWIYSDNFWLQRSAILFQLKYKHLTDKDKLFDYMERGKDSKEFFIQKAIGWALREYSKTAPEAVVNFIQSTDLAPLSRREGLKYLQKNHGTISM